MVTVQADRRDLDRNSAWRGSVGGVTVALVGLVGLLCLLALTAGLSGAGWTVAMASAAGLSVLLTRAMRRAGRTRLGPADQVTLARAVIACAVAGLTADVVLSSAAPTALVGLSLTAILADGVDGRVARRTGTASEFGARFDYEVDAFLILVLSVCVASTYGWWVLVLGLARYAFVAAGRVLPWLRAPLPPRPWAKVVAVVVALTLVVAASGALPDPITLAALVLAVGLLAESFAHSIVALMHLHGLRPPIAATLTAVLAVGLLWIALVAPDQPAGATPGAFLRIPVEGVLLVGLVLVLPRRPAVITALVAGFALGLLTVLRGLDLGFAIAFDKPFHPVYDATYAGPAVDLLDDAIGRWGTVAALLGIGAALIAVLTLLPLSAMRVAHVVGDHRRGAAAALVGVTALAVLAAATGGRPGSAAPLVSTSTADLVSSHARQIRSDLRDQREFDRELARPDPLAAIATTDLLTGLRGKDVLVVFVESYGRRALDLAAVRAALDRGQSRLGRVGLSAHSAWLTSPTFGGASWLAHATLQSGLWVDNERRFDELTARPRPTLTQAFARAGWRTLAVVPAVENAWPEGTSAYDAVYDSLNMGYRGPRFGWATMPDQFALGVLAREELSRTNRSPVMAEVTLVSSHWPWRPLPQLVDWNGLGDGSVFGPMVSGQPAGPLQDAQQTTAAYADSIAYTLDALTSFVEQLHDKDLVMLMLGDHQPSALVSGQDASRDVPVSLIAADPSVTARAALWGWRPGLAPESSAPVWPMDDLREKFVGSFSAATTHP